MRATHAPEKFMDFPIQCRIIYWCLDISDHLKVSEFIVYALLSSCLQLLKSFTHVLCKLRRQTLHKTMAEHDLVRLENELRTTETLQEEDLTGWDVLPREKLDPEYRRWPYFIKKVMKGSMHHSPQSVICIPTPFMREHPDTFQEGNLITLEGPSGNTWRVRATNKPILHSGWRAFAHDHHLREGDQLCFNLIQPLHFVVDVLTCNGDVKESALSATNTGKYTVASINNPCEYVRRSRKRRNMSPRVKTPRMSQGDFGYGVPAATIASRCKTTARRGSCNDYRLGTRLRFSDKTKQWECHEEMDGREVVTILDSDDEEAEEENRLLDHIELSFGSAQVQNYRTSKIQRLVEYMKAQGEYVPQWSIPKSQVAMAGEDQRTVATAGKLEEINHQEIVGHGQESLVAGASEPIVCEEAKTPAIAEKQRNEVRKEKLDSGIDPLPCQAQASCDEDTTMNKEEDETHLKDNVKLENTLENIHGAHSEALQSHKIPTTSQEGAAAEHESVRVNLLTNKVSDLPANPSQELLMSTAAMPDKVQEGGGEFLFETLQNIVDMPVIADAVDGGQIRDSVHPLKQDLIIQVLAQKNHDIRVEEELHLINKSKDSEHEQSILQSSSASIVYKNCESPMTKIEPRYGYGYGASENTEEKESTERYSNFLQPPKATVGHPRRHLEFKQFINNVVDRDIRIPKTPDAHEKVIQAPRPTRSIKDPTSTVTCVLKSKRFQVAKLDREKTLKAAQAWTKKLRNPNFVAVMQTSNVYQGFNMDIPGEFAKKCRLPATEAKAMLVCDEVPTTCKAVWEGANSEKPKLSAEGWMEFSRSHYLEEGDVCVFELFNRVTVRIGVHIFRVVGLRRSLVDWTQHYNVVHLGTHQKTSCSGAHVPLGSTRATPLEVL